MKKLPEEMTTIEKTLYILEGLAHIAIYWYLIQLLFERMIQG